MDLVEEVEPTPPPLLTSNRVAELERMVRESMEKRDRARGRLEELVRSTGCAHLEAPESSGQIVEYSDDTIRAEGRLGSSGDEDVVIGGVIVASSASTTKRKNMARRKKRKLLSTEREAENEKSRW